MKIVFEPWAQSNETFYFLGPIYKNIIKHEKILYLAVRLMLLVKLMAYFDKLRYERFYVLFFIDKVSNNAISLLYE